METIPDWASVHTYTNRECQTPRGIVDKYKVQSGITTDLNAIDIERATLKQVCNFNKLGGEEFFIGNSASFCLEIFYAPVPSVPVQK